MSRKNLVLSVHQLVDFLLREGSIDTRVFNETTMNEGTRLHAYYQSMQGDNYLSEYFLKQDFLFEDYKITLQGRADGIIVGKNMFTIDEIKTTLSPLDEFKNEHMGWHLGQAKCYAYMFMVEKNLKFMGIRLTYIRQGKKEKQIEKFKITFDEAKAFVIDLLDQYLLFYSIIERKRKERNATIKNLEFPFDSYRKGQRELAKYAYSIATKGGKLFVEAPTGIGKSMSTIFPYIKSLPKNETAKIFYLTAKGSGKESANNALEILRANGLKITSITISAKDKICPNTKQTCNPDECPLARNYYSKIQDIIKQTLVLHEDLNEEVILQIASEKSICPFELELDLSLYSDVIICDYNYLFDPTVYMKRFFDEDSTMHLVLVDEAHNLVDRSKDMYSASIDELTLEKAKKAMKKSDLLRLKRSVYKLRRDILLYKELYVKENTKFIEPFYDLEKSFMSFFNAYTDAVKEDNKNVGDDVKELFLQVNRFLKITDYFGPNFLYYIHNEDKKFSLNIKCLDASKYIRHMSSLVKGITFFSATLTPKDYFIDLLGGSKDDPFLHLSSPFKKSNFNVLVAPTISVKYKNRDATYGDVYEYVKRFISYKTGNYLMYVPSYDYLEKIRPYLDNLEVNLLYQERTMSDAERREFIDEFVYDPTETTLGVAVLGGTFSEGIDLVDTRLIGAIIVGVGLPKISYELDEVSSYYSQLGFNGHDYAYTNPGMNKVAQAVGRVIRSEEDKGAVLLIDERYTLNKYQDLFRSEWSQYKVVLSKEEIDEELSRFYSKK